jgi:hypothetical protein
VFKIDFIYWDKKDVKKIEDGESLDKSALKTVLDFDRHIVIPV